MVMRLSKWQPLLEQNLKMFNVLKRYSLTLKPKNIIQKQKSMHLIDRSVQFPDISTLAAHSEQDEKRPYARRNIVIFL